MTSRSRVGLYVALPSTFRELGSYRTFSESSQVFIGSVPGEMQSCQICVDVVVDAMTVVVVDVDGRPVAIDPAVM